MTATAFRFRHAAGMSAENEFIQWIRRQAGWDADPWGQALLSDKARNALRSSGFNGDSSLLECLLSGLDPYVREKYIEGCDSRVPALFRWFPDVAIYYKGALICTVDVKTTASSTSSNWSVEISSALSQQLLAVTGIVPLYVFTPSKQHDFWTCASAKYVLSNYDNAFNGKNVKGSGSPFVTVPKYAISKPFRHLMTQLELTGSAEFDGVIL